MVATRPLRLTFAIDSAIVIADTGDTAFLLDGRDGGSYRLDGSAGRMFGLLLGGATLGAVAGQVARENAVEPDVVAQDLLAFCLELEELGVGALRGDPEGD